jgi:hypothetical protein
MNELAIGSTLVAAMSLVAISSASAAPPTKTSTTPRALYAGDITGDGFLNGAWHLAQP